MPSVSACVSTRTLNRCTSRCCISILFNKEPACVDDFCLKALPDHSFMCHFPECTTFTGPHDNRLVGTQRKERDACQSGYIRAWPGGDGSVHDTSVTGHQETFSPPPFSQANGCQVREGLCSCLGQACCHVKSIRGRKHTGWAVDWYGRRRSEAEAGEEKKLFISQLYCTLHKDLLKQTEVEWKIDGDVLHYYCTSEPWVVSFYSEMARKFKIVSRVIQNMSSGSSLAVRKDTRHKVVFEFGKTLSKMVMDWYYFPNLYFSLHLKCITMIANTNLNTTILK